jgi:hypothetical protein
MRTPLALLFALPLLAGTWPSAGPGGFRVRSDFSAGLNADTGWAGAVNEHVAVQADRPFRLRFEVETDRSGPFRLQARRNGGAWEPLEAHDFPHPEGKKPKTPRASLVSCPAYGKTAATTDLLRGSAAPFRPGSGVGLADRTAPWTGGDAHGEFEWALVVRRFADGAETNETGDRFEFRMVAEDGAPLGDGPHPALRLEIPPGHVGGTFVETPGRIGPWRASNGDLYFVMEPAETSNLFMMIKSSDGGASWREVDAAHRPPTRDLESVDGRLVGDTIHLLHQVTRSVLHHSFRTSDHPTHPDTWDVRAEEAGKVNSVAQAATLAVRSDGSLVAFYVGQTKVHVGLRAPAGGWREVAVIDGAVGPQCVLGTDDAVHVAYTTSDGAVDCRRLGREGALTAPVRLASGLGVSRKEFGSVLPLVYHREKRTLIVLFRQQDGALWERRMADGAEPAPAVRVTDRPVVRDAVDSQQPGADVVLDGDTLRVLFIDEASRSIFATHDAGGWQPATRLVGGILGSWVRGGVYARRDGVKVYGYVYDAGSDGGAGMNRYGELPLGGP